MSTFGIQLIWKSAIKNGTISVSRNGGRDVRGMKYPRKVWLIVLWRMWKVAIFPSQMCRRV